MRLMDGIAPSKQAMVKRNSSREGPDSSGGAVSGAMNYDGARWVRDEKRDDEE